MRVPQEVVRQKTPDRWGRFQTLRFLRHQQFPQVDQPVEQRFPSLIAGKVIVADKKVGNALSGISAHDAFYIIGAAMPGLASLHVVVHRLHQIGQTGGGLNRQPTDATQVGGANPDFLDQ